MRPWNCRLPNYSLRLSSFNVHKRSKQYPDKMKYYSNRYNERQEIECEVLKSKSCVPEAMLKNLTKVHNSAIKNANISRFTYLFPLILNHVSAHCLCAAAKSSLQEQPNTIGMPDTGAPPSKLRWQILQSLSTLSLFILISEMPLSKSISTEHSEKLDFLHGSWTPSISKWEAPENRYSSYAEPAQFESYGECQDWSSASEKQRLSSLASEKRWCGPPSISSLQFSPFVAISQRNKPWCMAWKDL